MDVKQFFKEAHFAPNVPAIFERAAAAHAHLLEMVLQHKYQPSRLSTRPSTFFRNENITDHQGLPLYGYRCTTVLNNVNTHPDAVSIRETARAMLKTQYGEDINVHVEQDGYVFPVEWDVWFDKERTRKLKEQEIPTFSQNDFTECAYVTLKLNEPMYAFDFLCFCEKLLESGAAVSVKIEDERELKMVMPSTGNGFAEQERLKYLKQLLAPRWNILKEAQSFPDELIGKKEIFTPMTGALNNKFPAIREAMAAFTALKVGEAAAGMGLIVPLRERDVSFQKCLNLFGSPHGGTSTDDYKSAWTYQFNLQGALAVVEGLGDTVQCVVFVPHVETRMNHLEEFLSLLK